MGVISGVKYVVKKFYFTCTIMPQLQLWVHVGQNPRLCNVQICRMILKELAEKTIIRLCLILLGNHSGYIGNEKDDKLARAD